MTTTTARTRAQARRIAKQHPGARITRPAYACWAVTWPEPDRHGNAIAREGLDRCECGCKYWEQDRCVDCGESIERVAR